MNLPHFPAVCTGAVALLAPPRQSRSRAAPRRKRNLPGAGRRVAGSGGLHQRFRSQVKMTVIDDNTLLFRDGKVVYLQSPPGGCGNISNRTNALTTQRSSTNQLCAGDINQVVQPSSGIFRGSCAFGQFVPYRKVG